jgi:hypothetical protein
MASYSSDAFIMQPFTLNDDLVADTDPARFNRYKTYLDFYEGAQYFEKRHPGERRLTINYAREFIQKGVSYLMAKPVKVELQPGEGSTPEQAKKYEQVLADMWADNNLDRLDYDTAVDAAVAGDGAFKITAQKLGNKSPLEIGNNNKRPARVVVRSVDCAHLVAGWRSDDTQVLGWVEEKYSISQYEAVERFGELEHLTKKKPNSQVVIQERWTDSRLVITADKVVVIDATNPYGFIPYVIFPNMARPRRCWGLSDLEDIISINSEFNIRVSTLSMLLQMSGNPVLVLENIDSTEGIRVGPGAIWTIPQDAKASLLEMLKDGTVNLHLSYIELLYKMMHDLTELPSSGFGRDQSSGGPSSGVALEQLLFPVVQRVLRKRRIWDQVIDTRNRMMLHLAGLPVLRSKVVWPDILPKDRSGLVTQEVGLVASNIHSLETARRVLGDEQPELENALIKKGFDELGLPVGGPAGSNSSGKGIQPPVKLSGALVDGLSNSGG